MIKKYFSQYKEEFAQAIEDLKHKDTLYKQIPNLLTFMRLVLAIPAGILYYSNPILSILSITLLWLTDAVDGKMARKFNIQSKLGADMDTVADKVMFLASSIPLLTSIPSLGLNLLLEGIIASVNVLGRIRGLNTKTVFSGKLKTVSLAITLVYGYLYKFLGLPNLINIPLLGITSFLQILALNDYIDEYKIMNEEQKNNNIKENETKNETEVYQKRITKQKELTQIKPLILSSQTPSKVYTGKKRVRKLIQEKRTF